MNGFGNWLRNIGIKFTEAMRRFMLGRYGTDKLNMALLYIGLIASLLGMFIKLPLVNLIITAISYTFLILVIFRTLSRNTYKRYQENRKYLAFMQQIKDREHRYFDCPRCRQQVRVPRKKGKISITCPKCQEKFIRKT